VKRDGIELVIPHHCVPVAVLNRRPRDLNGFRIRRSSVNEVTHEDDLSFCMSKSVTTSLVAQLAEQLPQLFCVTVNVTDDVVMRHSSPCSSIEVCVSVRPRRNGQFITEHRCRS